MTRSYRRLKARLQSALQPAEPPASPAWPIQRTSGKIRPSRQAIAASATTVQEAVVRAERAIRECRRRRWRRRRLDSG